MSEENKSQNTENNKSLVRDIQDSEFYEVLARSRLPLLVDFWAPWCGPCRALAPVLEEVAKAFSTKIHIYKMNVDDNTEIPSQCQVRSIPNLIIFDPTKCHDLKDDDAKFSVKSTILSSKVGMHSKETLESWIEEALDRIAPVA